MVAGLHIRETLVLLTALVVAACDSAPLAKVPAVVPSASASTQTTMSVAALPSPRAPIVIAAPSYGSHMRFGPKGSAGRKLWEVELDPALGPFDMFEVDGAILVVHTQLALYSQRPVIERLHPLDGRRISKTTVPGSGIVDAALDDTQRLWLLVSFFAPVRIAGIAVAPRSTNGDFLVARYDKEARPIDARLASFPNAVPPPKDWQPSRLVVRGGRGALLYSLHASRWKVVQLADDLGAKSVLDLAEAANVLPSGQDGWLTIDGSGMNRSIVRRTAQGRQHDAFVVEDFHDAVPTASGDLFVTQSRMADGRGSAALSRIDASGKQRWLRGLRAEPCPSNCPYDREVSLSFTPTSGHGGVLLLGIPDSHLSGLDGLQTAGGGEILLELDRAGTERWRARVSSGNDCTYSPVTTVLSRVHVGTDGVLFSFYCPGGQRVGTCIYTTNPNCRASSGADAGLLRYTRP